MNESMCRLTLQEEIPLYKKPTECDHKLSCKNILILRAILRDIQHIGKVKRKSGSKVLYCVNV